MRKPLPEIQESESELKEMLRTEKRTRQRQRLQMLYLVSAYFLFLSYASYEFSGIIEKNILQHST